MNRLAAAALVVALAAAATAAALLASRDRAPVPAAGPEIELLDAPVEDWMPPDGKPSRVVYPVWRSVGGRPVRAVVATVRGIGPGRAVVWEARGVMIYTAPPGSPGVQPGEEYHTPEDKGIPIPDRPGDEELMVEVEITGATG